MLAKHRTHSFKSRTFHQFREYKIFQPSQPGEFKLNKTVRYKRHLIMAFNINQELY